MSPVRPDWFYTYVLLSEIKGNWYTDVANNLTQRLKQHNDGSVFLSKKMRPLQLIYFEACMNYPAASCGVSSLSFRLVRNLPVSKIDSRQAGMTKITKTIETPKQSFEEFFRLNKSDAYRREKYLPRLDFSNIWRLMKSINWLTVLNWESLTGFKSGIGKRYLRNRLSGGLTG